MASKLLPGVAVGLPNRLLKAVRLWRGSASSRDAPDLYFSSSPATNTISAEEVMRRPRLRKGRLNQPEAAGGALPPPKAAATALLMIKAHATPASSPVAPEMSLSSPADACTSSAGEVTRKPRLQRGFLPAQGRRAAVCAAEGCNKRAFLDPSTGNASSACKRLHTGVRLIGRGREFELCLLDPANEDSDSIKSQFNGGWKEAGNVPEVVRIFRVVMPDAIFELYNAYADRVGNKRRRFHGTARSPACDFLVTLQGSPCDERDCRTCSICTHGFQKTARPNPNWRFGEGIYSSSSSAKANNPYADGSELVHTDGKRYRSMFVCTVAAGYNVFKTQGGAAAAAPPSGTTAVVGDVGPILHHDELVVYENAAVLPTHIIVYTLD